MLIYNTQYLLENVRLQLYVLLLFVNLLVAFAKKPKFSKSRAKSRTSFCLSSFENILIFQHNLDMSFLEKQIVIGNLPNNNCSPRILLVREKVCSIK